MRFAGKVAIVTGGAAGLGEAIARRLAAEGARVILTDVSPAGAEVAASIGASARFVHHDVRDQPGWQALVAEVEAREGRLDVLVNNAGIVELDTPESIDEASYRAVLGVSLDGVVWGCKYAIAAMVRAGGGSIVNLSSIAAVQGEPNNASYTAAKGAIDAYSRMVSVYCAQKSMPVRCNAVLPSGMTTPMVASIPEKRRAAGAAAGLIEIVPGAANARGVPDDVAGAVLFLASDDARWINGQSIVIDNGASVTKGVVPLLQK
ncbi:SDR family oxidoreductase [Polymorphobacter sp.]|uniref:SDR family oxidoreductase n=1 Tax=Polymorphobacter sp. TaxID=1909290 RepID=UPI003F6F466C